MKELKFYDCLFGQIFYTDDDWSYIHENDGSVRKEFFDSVFNLVGAELIEIGSFTELPKNIQEHVCEMEFSTPEEYN